MRDEMRAMNPELFKPAASAGDEGETLPTCEVCGGPVTLLQSQLPGLLGTPRHRNCPVHREAGDEGSVGK